MKYRAIIQELIQHYMFDPWDHTIQEEIETTFRSQCPGPYRFVWKDQLDEDYMPQYTLIFEETDEATFWLLRWS